MTAFVITALLIAVLALGLVLRPLWRGSRAVALTMAASLAVIASVLYLTVGTPRALDPTQRRAPETLADAVTQLEAELKRDPNQPEGWRLLARAHAAQGNREQARDAYAQAVKLAPDEPDVLVEAAEARALAAPDRGFDTEGVAMLRRALERQPMHQRARWFLGIAHRQAGQSAEAAAMWEPLLGIVDKETVESLRAQINAARAEAGMPPLPSDPSATGPQALLRITVDVASELKPMLKPGDVLFVLARQPNGPPMPIAVKRVPATGFPLVVELSDGDSPMPTMKLSQAGTVEILARISRLGVANRGTGDLESAPEQAQPKAGAQYDLRIDSMVE